MCCKRAWDFSLKAFKLSFHLLFCSNCGPDCQGFAPSQWRRPCKDLSDHRRRFPTQSNTVPFLWVKISFRAKVRRVPIGLDCACSVHLILHSSTWPRTRPPFSCHQPVTCTPPPLHTPDSPPDRTIASVLTCGKARLATFSIPTLYRRMVSTVYTLVRDHLKESETSTSLTHVSYRTTNYVLPAHFKFPPISDVAFVSRADVGLNELFQFNIIRALRSFEPPPVHFLPVETTLGQGVRPIKKCGTWPWRCSTAKTSSYLRIVNKFSRR